MDSQGRRHSGSGSPGRSGDIDPADQWVLDPETGTYEFRPTPDSLSSPEAPPRTSRRRPSGGGVPRQAGSPEGRRRARNGGDSPAPGGRATRRAGQGGGPGGDGGRAGGAGRRRPKGKSKGKKALHWTAGTLGFLLVAGCTGGYFVYQHFNGNINSYKADLGDDRPSAGADGAMNILMIGTDSRKGLGKKYGDEGSAGHADTTFLFHVSKDRTNATAVSIPRDLMVPIPECRTEDKSRTIPGQAKGMFNTSLGQDERGPDCTWKTVEALTGIRVDHFMMVDFNAVKTMSTAVGGVEVCLAKDIRDRDSKLNLSAGKHTIKGEQALSFVRTRHSVGLGGDLTRIPLQQQFLSSMIRKVKSNGTLSSPTKLWDLADAATKSLTVDSGIGSVKKLMSLGQDLGEVNTKNITFATVPVADDPADKNRLVLKEKEARQLFAMVKADHSLTKVGKKGKKAGPAPTETTKAAPANVRVKVVNGSGKVGAAQVTVSWLQNSQGVIRSSNGLNAPATARKTNLVYAPNQGDQARALAEIMGLPDSALKEKGPDAAPLDEMTLTLGQDFEGAGVPLTAPTAAPSDLQSVNADDKNVCAK
ncbi:LCP family protein [Wenjunlia tyrosinilytica]|uniref:LCP family protein n=1 Tax=Wenjunlia tyrosinilytica TaxID=1544741 RepID=UPI001E38D447|nr:LCP family protein [Wenjunlia tyrosinilytica]